MRAFLHRCYLYWTDPDAWRAARCAAGYHDWVYVPVDAGHYALVCHHCPHYDVFESWGE